MTPALWGAITILVASFALGPVLLSHDVYSYVDYARLGVVHGLDPYVFTPAAALKATAALSVLGIAALVYRLAPSRGVAPLPAAAFVALNPLVLIHVVGGAHNDGLAMLLATLSIAALLSAREASAGALGHLRPTNSHRLAPPLVPDLAGPFGRVIERPSLAAPNPRADRLPAPSPHAPVNPERGSPAQRISGA